MYSVRSNVVFLVFALRLGAVVAEGQDRRSDWCGTIVTIRDASGCIASAQRIRAVPVLDRRHAYNLMELIDIAEDANPEGRIVWAAAERPSRRRAGQYLASGKAWFASRKAPPIKP